MPIGKILIFLLIISGFVPVHAQLKKGVCKEYIDKFCYKTGPSPGLILACLKEHENQLSPACKANCEAIREKAKNIMTACKDDIKTHCAAPQLAEGRIVKCLKNAKGLSTKCQTALAPKK